MQDFSFDYRSAEELKLPLTPANELNQPNQDDSLVLSSKDILISRQDSELQPFTTPMLSRVPSELSGFAPGEEGNLNRQSSVFTDIVLGPRRGGSKSNSRKSSMSLSSNFHIPLN